MCCKFFLARRGENYKLPLPLSTFRTSETTVWGMPTSATEQAGHAIPLGLPRADGLETSVNVPTSPGSCPLEGRALTFSSPVPVVAAAVSLEDSNVVGITHGDVHSLDRVSSITMNDMLESEERRDDMFNNASQEQADGKIGQHDAKIQSFQERIDKAEELIHDLEVIIVDRQEDDKALTTRRHVAITTQLAAKRKRIQGG